MNNKTTIIGMTVLALLCVGYFFFLKYEWKAHPEWNLGTPDQSSQTTTEPSSTEPSVGATTIPSLIAATNSSPIVAATQEITAATTQPTTQASLGAVSGGASGSALIGSDQPGDASYALGMQINPAGAAIGSVTINSYKNDDANGLYVYQQPNTDYQIAALGTKSVTIDGKTLDVSGMAWQLESKAPLGPSATFGLDILAADHKPLLHVDKTFEIAPRGPKNNRDNTAAGYETVITYHLRNLSSGVLKNVQIETDGPTMPGQEMERFDDRQIVSGYDKGNNNVDLLRDTLSEFKQGNDDKDVSTKDGNKILWTGMCSNYFAAIIFPDKQGLISAVKLHCPNASDPSGERVVDMDLQSQGFALSAGGTVDLPLRVFFGPKERDLLEGDYYRVFPRAYNQLLNSSSSFCGVCAFSWLVDLLVYLLAIFHFVLRDWGLAIIALVVLVRAILHPISKHSQVSMLSLQKMGPELEKLKKKYGDDKDALAKAQMEMHKEMGIAPFLGCLPMFLQMPIWIALYSALQNDMALRQAPFLYFFGIHFTWIHDLARPDRLITWQNYAFTVPIIGMKVVSLNILPLIVAVVMFLQQKLTPQAPAMTAEQASQQKMMRYMSLLFSLFFYWMPSGLNLYILTSSTIAIFESKIIRDHIQKKKDEESSGKVIVDANQTRKGKQRGKVERVEQEQKSGCLGGAWANLQQKAEEVQREAERRQKKRG